jgi:hypothetical protein
MKSKWLRKTISLFLKIFILALAVVFLYQRLDYKTFQSLFEQEFDNLFAFSLSFLVLWMLNILLDAIFWSKVHHMVEPVSFLRALKINLVCYSLAFITPAGSGEWAGRYLMMGENGNRKKAFFLNFWIGIPKYYARILISILAGAAVLHLFNLIETSWIITSLPIVLAIVIFTYFSFKKLQNWLHLKKIGPYKLEDYLLNDRPTSRERIRFLLIALGKFLIYNVQFALVLILFSENPLPLEIWFLIPVYYLISSSLPSFAFADFVLKSAIALWIFKPVVSNEPLLVLTSLTIWGFNIVIPAFIGLYFILKTDLYSSFKRKFARGIQSDS